MLKLFFLCITFLFAQNHTENLNKPLQEKPFFTIQPFNISILTTKGKPVMIVTIECILETLPEKWEKMRLKIPEIYNHMLIDLYQSLNFLWTRKSPPNPITLKKRLLKVLQTKFGKDSIKDVIITSVIVECEDTVKCEDKE